MDVPFSSNVKYVYAKNSNFIKGTNRINYFYGTKFIHFSLLTLNRITVENDIGLLRTFIIVNRIIDLTRSIFSVKCFHLPLGGPLFDESPQHVKRIQTTISKNQEFPLCRTIRLVLSMSLRFHNITLRR